MYHTTEDKVKLIQNMAKQFLEFLDIMDFELVISVGYHDHSNFHGAETYQELSKCMIASMLEFTSRSKSITVPEFADEYFVEFTHLDVASHQQVTNHLLSSLADIINEHRGLTTPVLEADPWA